MSLLKCWYSLYLGLLSKWKGYLLLLDFYRFCWGCWLWWRADQGLTISAVSGLLSSRVFCFPGMCLLVYEWSVLTHFSWLISGWNTFFWYLTSSSHDVLRCAIARISLDASYLTVMQFVSRYTPENFSIWPKCCRDVTHDSCKPWQPLSRDREPYGANVMCHSAPLDYSFSGRASSY